jgi:predicted nucleic acid-binding protein
MTFADIADGTAVFIDANGFVYSATAHPTLGPPRRRLLDRVARQEIVAYTSADAVSDVGHRVMTLEAAAAKNWPASGLAFRLKQQPAAIQQLSQFRRAIEEIVRIGIRVLPIDAGLVLAAGSLSQQYGLLSGDALLISVMQHHALTHLASNDGDFDRVPGITRYAPL